MPRPGLTYDDVAQAANTLNQQGTNPTIQNIRESLGTGSPITISKHLKTWKEAQKSGLIQPEAPAAAERKLSRRAPASVESTPETLASEDNTVQVETIEALSIDTNTPNDISNINESASMQKAPAKTFNKRERPQQAKQPQDQSKPKTQKLDSFELTAASLMGLSEDHLKIKILQLETAIAKEQSRREAAEAMARDIKDYAELLKSEVQQRITDMEQAYDRTIAELKANAEQLRKNAAEDLKYYRSALEKANVKLSQK